MSLAARVYPNPTPLQQNAEGDVLLGSQAAVQQPVCAERGDGGASRFLTISLRRSTRVA